MPAAPETTPTSVDPQQVLRRSRGLLARRFAQFFGTFGFLMVLPMILGKLGAPNSVWAAFPAFPGVIGMVFTLRAFAGRPFRIRKARKILDQYDLEQNPHARFSEPVRFNGETRFVFEIDEPDSDKTQRMVALDVQGHGKPLKGIDEGVWTAGDLPFGGVIVLPGSNTLLLMRPENWDETAPRRNGASPGRIERAKRAGIELIAF